MLTLDRSDIRTTRYRLIETQFGVFALVITQHAQPGTQSSRLSTLWLDAPARRLLGNAIEDRRLLPDLASRLRSYFRCSGHSGEVSFDDVPLPEGTEFFRQCWTACRAIPLGKTLSYSELALAAGGTASAARAAGQAMRRNPMPIITPCHRVIGADGALHGFAGSMARRGSALALKGALLELEASKAARMRFD